MNRHWQLLMTILRPSYFLEIRLGTLQTENGTKTRHTNLHGKRGVEVQEKKTFRKWRHWRISNEILYSHHHQRLSRIASQQIPNKLLTDFRYLLWRRGRVNTKVSCSRCCLNLKIKQLFLLIFACPKS